MERVGEEQEWEYRVKMLIVIEVNSRADFSS